MGGLLRSAQAKLARQQHAPVRNPAPRNCYAQLAARRQMLQGPQPSPNRRHTVRYSFTILVTCTLIIGCNKSAPESNAPQNEGSAANVRPPAAQNETPTAKPLPDRDPQLAKKLVSQGAILLDVRSQGEWDERHLEGANHIPIDEFSSRMADISQLTSNDKSKPVVVYCKSGGRAGRAKKMLLKAGYTQVTNMGGISDWPQE